MGEDQCGAGAALGFLAPWESCFGMDVPLVPVISGLSIKTLIIAHPTVKICILLGGSTVLCPTLNHDTLKKLH